MYEYVKTKYVTAAGRAGGKWKYSCKVVTFYTKQCQAVNTHIFPTAATTKERGTTNKPIKRAKLTQKKVVKAGRRIEE